jgi:hypothetical protein
MHRIATRMEEKYARKTQISPKPNIATPYLEFSAGRIIFISTCLKISMCIYPFMLLE